MKFVGKIGFWIDDVETAPSVYEPKIIEKPYVGDVTRNYRRNQYESGKQNKNLSLNNQIDILADTYLQQNYHTARYVLWNNVRWEVTAVEVDYPKIKLEIGGVYDGIEARQDDE